MQQTSTRNVILEVKSSQEMLDSGMRFDSDRSPSLSAEALADLPSVQFDKSFGAVQLPFLLQPSPSDADPADLFDLSQGRSIDEDHELSSFIVRASVDENELKKLEKEQKSASSRIIGIYSDPEIEVCDPTPKDPLEESASGTSRICPGAPALGNDRHVAARLGIPNLHRRRMNGSGVYVAIVDTGINLSHLRSRGKSPMLDIANSWMARPGDVAGRLPVGHGTMVAYDALIAAPRATLLDIALLRTTRTGGSVMAGFLSDAVKAFAHLYRIMRSVSRPGGFRSMVVNNSWGMFNESWDFPVGHPGRYLDNPAHPFNRIVGVLEHAGADIVFAAGNCGRDCPDGRCQGDTKAGIMGANSHPQVLSVAGVDLLKRRVGYSTSGPGRLSYMKPDLCGYTHFRGSGVYPADGGTSAAAPVVSGLVAAFRSRFPYIPGNYRTTPAAIRNILTRTAEDRGSLGFDFDYGWGIASGQKLALIRSLSVTSTEEEPAASIDELTDAEDVLDQIPGLDQVPDSPETARLSVQGSLAYPEPDFPETSQYSGLVPETAVGRSNGRSADSTDPAASKRTVGKSDAAVV